MPSRRLGASRAAARRRVSGRGAHSLFRAFGATVVKPPLGGVTRSYTRRRVRCRGAHSLPGVRYGTCQAAARERLALLLAVESAAESPSLSIPRAHAMRHSPSRRLGTLARPMPAVAPRVCGRGAVSTHLLFCDYFIFYLACRLVPSSCRLPSAHLVTHPIRTPSPSSLAATQHSQPCLLYTSPSPRDRTRSRMPSSA